MELLDLNSLLNDPSRIEEIDTDTAKQLLAQIASFSLIQPLLLCKVLSGNDRQKAIPDELLTIKEASSRYSMSTDYLYRNQADLPFIVRIGDHETGPIRISVK